MTVYCYKCRKKMESRFIAYEGMDRKLYVAKKAGFCQNESCDRHMLFAFGIEAPDTLPEEVSTETKETPT